MPDFKWNTLKYSKKRALLIKKNMYLCKYLEIIHLTNLTN